MVRRRDTRDGVSSNLQRAFPAPKADCFVDLLQAIDEAANIAELRERLRDYRLRSRSPYKPIAAAYAESAKELEAKLIAETRRGRTENAKSGDEK